VADLYWTPENVAHIARHEVTPDDVVEVLVNQPHYYDAKPDKESLVVLGPNRAGRYLLVVVVEAVVLPDAWYVVTAHWLNRRRAERLYLRE
jgi:uncharacterized protein